MSAPRIHRLSPDLINKIAAGEVVERPASVVKELVENSIDAESSRIDITLEEGGKRLIRVADDGAGMSPDDLALAFESHATSKLGGVEDLFKIETLGFRGEALASIASVSRCRAVSRERGATEGVSVECEAGRLGEVRACGAPEGTLIEVRDLFFNTPARLKFLPTTATELRHTVEMVTRLALPHHALTINLVHNGRPVLKLPSADSERERLAAFFGKELPDRLLAVHSESSALAVTGFVSPPGEGEPSSIQYIFLNGRYIRDRAISRAITEAYRSRLLRNRFPAVVLNLQMNPDRVDVNVHPTKVEVRFRDSSAVFAQVLTALEKTLAAAGPKTVLPPSTDASAPVAGGAARPSLETRRENVRQAVADFLDHATARQEPLGPLAAPQQAPPSGEAPASTQTITPQSVTTSRAEDKESGDKLCVPGIAPRGPVPRTFCQVHGAYIVEETEGGFLVIDQHALHERILYEELRQRVHRASVPRQRLLVPEIVDLRPEEYIRVMELKDALLKLGLEVEPFGERTVAVHAVPHLAGPLNPYDLLTEILRDTAESESAGPTDREERLMRTIACKAAVKAGERLPRAQIEALLDRRDRLGPEPTCPHGRPTTLRFDLREIEKQFKRK